MKGDGKPRVLLDPERVIVLSKPAHALGSININKQTMRVRTCPDCQVATTMVACPCCARSTISDVGVSEAIGESFAIKVCPSCRRNMPAGIQVCAHCGHDFAQAAPPTPRLEARERPALEAAPAEGDVIDVGFTEKP